VAEIFEKSLDVRWADVDANRHMRHSAYADFAAFSRVGFFEARGFDMKRFAELDIGPILFREELVYRREILMFETITITCRLAGLSKDAERWSIYHELLKSDGQLAATIHVDGAWIDLPSRKLCAPPLELMNTMLSLEKTPDFAHIPVKSPPEIHK